MLTFVARNLASPDVADTDSLRQQKNIARLVAAGGIMKADARQVVANNVPTKRQNDYLRALGL